MEGRLSGEVAIVTGAGRGIGAAIARIYAGEGAAVLVADRDGGTAQAVAEAIAQDGGRAVAATADVADPAAVTAMAEAGRRAFGPIGLLVNNAGIAVFADPLELSAAEYRRLFDVDLDAVWHTSCAVLPDMLDAGRGAIVNIASVHSFRVMKGSFPYQVAKHGVIGMTRAMALDYAGRGVRVNAICPGYVDTPINAEVARNAGRDPAAFTAEAAAIHPPGRVAVPEDIAWPAVFLASHREAGFVNGASLLVDGGRSNVYQD